MRRRCGGLRSALLAAFEIALSRYRAAAGLLSPKLPRQVSATVQPYGDAPTPAPLTELSAHRAGQVRVLSTSPMGVRRQPALPAVVRRREAYSGWSQPGQWLAEGTPMPGPREIDSRLIGHVPEGHPENLGHAVVIPPEAAQHQLPGVSPGTRQAATSSGFRSFGPRRRGSNFRPYIGQAVLEAGAQEVPL